MGEIRYEKRCCAFVDFLGFKNFVKNKKAEEIYKVISTLSDENKKNSENVFENLKYQAFSDNIFLSTPHTKFDIITLCLQVNWLFMRALQNGVLIRGAITVGDIHQDDNKNIVFGDALIETYELESKIAIYPRVILSKSAHSFIEANDADILEQYFRQSKDGIWFLHIFVDNVRLAGIDWQSTAKPIIEKMLRDNIDKPEAYKKVKWFAAYYNKTVEQDVFKGDKIEFLLNKDKFIQLPSWR